MTKQAAPQQMDFLKTYPAYVPEHYEKLEFSKKVMPKEEFSRFFTSEAGVRADNLDFFSCTLFYSVYWFVADRPGIYFFSNTESRGAEDPRPDAFGGYLIWQDKVIRILFHEFYPPSDFIFRDEYRGKIQVYWAIFQINLVWGWGELQSFKGTEIVRSHSRDLQQAKSMVYSVAKGIRSVTGHYVFKDCKILFIDERLDVEPVVVEGE
jgi:hypothetical protein